MAQVPLKSGLVAAKANNESAKIAATINKVFLAIAGSPLIMILNE
jgi:hypothetical protein